MISQSQVPAKQSGRARWPLWLVALVAFFASLIATPRAMGQDESAADLAALERAFQRVVEQVSPSVVGLRVQRRQAAPSEAADPLAPAAPAEQLIAVNGCGTVVDADGLILTNEHVVQSAVLIDASFHDGQHLPARVLAADPRSDLAILQVPRTGLQPAQMCTWNAVARGQWAVVVGNPFGLGGDGRLSVSVGVIANLGRQLPGLGETDDRFYRDMIQITAPISPGNSGGPLFSVRGELMGIVTAMHMRAAADEGVGFAIPMNPAKRAVIELLQQGRTIEYGYLGLTVRAPEQHEREWLGTDHGVIVQRVDPTGPAAEAGLSVGDALLKFDGQAILGPGQLAEWVGQCPVGRSVPLEILRARTTLAITARVARRDSERVASMREPRTVDALTE